jgi:hypothetical protein
MSPAAKPDGLPTKSCRRSEIAERSDNIRWREVPGLPVFLKVYNIASKRIRCRCQASNWNYFAKGCPRRSREHHRPVMVAIPLGGSFHVWI